DFAARPRLQFLARVELERDLALGANLDMALVNGAVVVDGNVRREAGEVLPHRTGRTGIGEQLGGGGILNRLGFAARSRGEAAIVLRLRRLLLHRRGESGGSIVTHFLVLLAIAFAFFWLDEGGADAVNARRLRLDQFKKAVGIRFALDVLVDARN